MSPMAMGTRQYREAMTRKTVVRSIGIAICLVALFMPAVRLPQQGGWPDLIGGQKWGIYCAVGTCMGLTYFVNEPSTQPDQAERILEAILMALINPLLVVYVTLSSDEKRNRSRRILAGAIVAGCVTTLIYLVSVQANLLVGYFCWIAGVTLTLSPSYLDALSRCVDWFRGR
jgi:ABC-type Fe3+-siderophore transport system permease subunit